MRASFIAAFVPASSSESSRTEPFFRRREEPALSCQGEGISRANEIVGVHSRPLFWPRFLLRRGAVGRPGFQSPTGPTSRLPHPSRDFWGGWVSRTHTESEIVRSIAATQADRNNPTVPAASCPPLQTTQGWGTLTCGNSSQAKGGPPASGVVLGSSLDFMRPSW